MKFWLIGLTIYFLLVSPSVLYADSGFMYKGDLNQDGVEDFIYSGPLYLFGNGGGPCLMQISVSENKHKQKIVTCVNRLGINLERKNKLKPASIWGYSRYTAGSGALCALTLDGEFIQECISIYPGTTDSPKSIDSAILGVINHNTKFVAFAPVESGYIPPDTPCGSQWGKGCESITEISIPR